MDEQVVLRSPKYTLLFFPLLSEPPALGLGIDSLIQSPNLKTMAQYRQRMSKRRKKVERRRGRIKEPQPQSMPWQKVPVQSL